MARGRKKGGSSTAIPQAETYKHLEADSPLRPEVGTQPQFKKKKPPQRYLYDSSLSPAPSVWKPLSRLLLNGKKRFPRPR